METTAPRGARRATTKPPYDRWKIVAAVAGCLGALLAIALPFLPVKQQLETINWPQRGQISSVNAPLAAYVPIELHLNVPCSLADALPGGEGTLLSTLPAGGKRPSLQGLFVTVTAETVSVSDRDVVFSSASRADVTAAGAGCRIVFDSTPERTSAKFEGVPPAQQDNLDVADPNLRPQLTGVYTDLPTSAPIAGATFSATVDNRFSTSPSLMKAIATWFGLAMTVLSLVALGLLDMRDGRGHRRIMPRGWLRPRWVDVFVVGFLGVWWLIGPGTSDDGYQYTMATQAPHSGYLINFFRSFSVPEIPFGWNDYLFTALTPLGHTSAVLRLFALTFGALTWLLLAREVLPRLGRTVARSQAAQWAAAGGFLAVWLPLNNGLRPEPAVVLFSLLAWVSIERSIATGRLLPVAIALPCAALSLGAAPGGILAIATVLAASRHIVTRIIKRRERDGLLPLLAPLAAAGFAYLYFAFGDQTFAAVREAVAVKNVTGPTLEWYEEGVRYYYLMIQTIDGSTWRRFGVLLGIFCLLFVLVNLLRKRPRGVAVGPVWRLIALFFATIIMLAFTPTKWTHHLGLFAGFAGALAGITGALVVPAMLRSARNRVLFTAALCYVFAVSAAGPRGYWFTGSYGVNQFNSPISVAGISLAWWGFAIASVLALYGLYLHLRQPYVAEPDPEQARTRWRRWIPAPVGAVAIFVCLLQLVVVVVAAYDQRDSYSWTNANARAITGNSCSMANDVLVETDVNAALLTPAPGPNGARPSATAALTGTSTGFSGGDLPDAAYPKNPDTVDGWGTAKVKTVNGSPATLPYGLNPTTTPLLTNYNGTTAANLTSGWYTLPPRTESTPLVTVSAAGAVKATSLDGAPMDGRTVVLEAGKISADGSVAPVATVTPIDVGPTSVWRNLRFPTAQIPRDADVVRLVVNDKAAPVDQWVAITPPRMASMQTAQQYLGTDKIVLVDFLPAFAFPCQRQMRMVEGIAEVPQFRVVPDYKSKRDTTDTWQGWKTGGPLGITDAMLAETYVPTYLRNNWDRDWGNIIKFTPWVNAQPAIIDSTSVTRWGTYNPGEMRSANY